MRNLLRKQSKSSNAPTSWSLTFHSRIILSWVQDEKGPGRFIVKCFFVFNAKAQSLKEMSSFPLQFQGFSGQKLNPTPPDFFHFRKGVLHTQNLPRFRRAYEFIRTLKYLRENSHLITCWTINLMTLEFLCPFFHPTCLHNYFNEYRKLSEKLNMRSCYKMPN